MSFKDQQRRRRVAEKRGRRGSRRAGAMLLRQAVLHPVDAAAIGKVFEQQEGQDDGGSE